MDVPQRTITPFTTISLRSRDGPQEGGKAVEMNQPLTTFTVFNNLPPELQTEIWRHLGIQGIQTSRIHIGGPYGRTLNSSSEFRAVVQRYRRVKGRSACKTANQQILSVFYSHNGFETHNLTILEEFLSTIGIHGRRSLRKLKIVFELSKHIKDDNAVQKAYKAFRYLLSCTGLRSLEIGVLTKCPLHTPDDEGITQRYYPVPNALSLLNDRDDALALNLDSDFPPKSSRQYFNTGCSHAGSISNDDMSNEDLVAGKRGKTILIKALREVLKERDEPQDK